MERLGRRIEVWKPQISMFDHHRFAIKKAILK